MIPGTLLGKKTESRHCGKTVCVCVKEIYLSRHFKNHFSVIDHNLSYRWLHRPAAGILFQGRRQAVRRRVPVHWRDIFFEWAKPRRSVA